MGDATTRPGAPGRQRPPDRYGAPPTRGRRLGTYLLGGIVAALALAALVSVALHKSAPPIAAGLRGYDIVSDSAVRIRFEVHKSPLAHAVCTVRARDRSGAETGRAEVPVGSRRDSRRVTEVTYDLATRTRAVTGELAGCQLVRAR